MVKEQAVRKFPFKKAYFFIIFCIFLLNKTDMFLIAQPVLMDNGVSEYVIVISTNPEPTEYFAAQELQMYLEQMSGIKLPIKSDVEAQGRNLLSVGKNTLTDRLNITLKPRFPLDDLFIIRNLGDMIILLGCSSRSTLFAVYQFLEFLGCRWYAPNLALYNSWTGEYIPEQNQIYINELNYQFEPAFKWRRIAPDFTGASNVMDSIAVINWAVKNKFNIFDFLDNQHENLLHISSPVLQAMQLRNLPIAILPEQLLSVIMTPAECEIHPEWLRLIGGFRSWLSRIEFEMKNPELRLTLSHLVQKNLAAFPPLGMVVSDNPPVENNSSVSWQLVQRFFPNTLVKMTTLLDNDGALPTVSTAYHVLIDFACSENLVDGSFDRDEMRNLLFRKRKNVTYPIGLTFLQPSNQPNASEFSLGIPQHLDEFRRWGISMMCWSPRLASWAARELEHYLIASAMTSVEIDFHQIIGEYGTCRFGAPGVQWWQFFTDLSHITEQFLDFEKSNATFSELHSRMIMIDKYLLKLNSLLQHAIDDEQKSFFLKKQILYLQYVKLKFLLLDDSTTTESRTATIQQMQQLLTDPMTVGLVERLIDSPSK